MLRRLSILVSLTLLGSLTFGVGMARSANEDLEYHELWAEADQGASAVWAIPRNVHTVRLYAIGAVRSFQVADSSYDGRSNTSITYAYVGTGICPRHLSPNTVCTILVQLFRISDDDFQMDPLFISAELDFDQGTFHGHITWQGKDVPEILQPELALQPLCRMPPADPTMERSDRRRPPAD